LVVRFSDKSPVCWVSFFHFALTITAPAYHFALRNYDFLMGEQDISPSTCQSVGVSPIYLTRNDLHGQKTFRFELNYSHLGSK
jgi:hypothetical protein